MCTGHYNGELHLFACAFIYTHFLTRITHAHTLCRGMTVLEDEQLVCTGHYNGELHLFAQPPLEVMVPPGAQAAMAESFGTFRPKTAMLKVGFF